VKVLVIASEPISADRLRATLGEAIDDAEILVVAPALHRSALRFWLSDADEPIRRAELVQRETVEDLDAAVFDAHGVTAESDPVKAVEDVLVTFPAERIVLSLAPSPRGATTRASTPTHCSNGLACRSSAPNESQDPYRRVALTPNFWLTRDGPGSPVANGPGPRTQRLLDTIDLRLGAS
jgi:hypothetical protein